jgi:hypothetical protein
MKIKLFSIWFLVSAAFCLNMAAQESSTEANPKWFFIQVKGASSDTYDRVLTEIDDEQVVGKPLATSDINELNKQLWRFEVPSGVQGYRVINKYSKKQLTVVFHSGTNQRRLGVTGASTVFWYPVSSSTTGYIYWRIVNEPTEGVAGAIFLSQTSDNSYAYRLVTQADRTTNDEIFRCVRNNIPVASSDNTTIWMNIRNPKTDKYLTDAVSSTSGINFTLENKDGSSFLQQWKMIPKGNGNLEFVNRATGNIISTETNLNKYYYVDYTTHPAESAGWKYAPTANNAVQYVVFSTEADGVVSYWNATTDGQAPDSYSVGKAAGSTYAWIFSWVEEIYTSIQPSVVLDNIRVYSANKRIYVEGCDEYRITSISGMPVRKNSELPIGIYLVTVKGKTTKVLVK